jgi:hypothetical protein
MKEDSAMKEDEANKKPLWPFILATLFSLPLFIIAVSYIFNMPIIGILHLPFINIFTAGPLIVIAAGIASVCIFFSWIASPSWCRFILSFYLLVILVILILLFPSSGYDT